MNLANGSYYEDDHDHHDDRSSHVEEGRLRSLSLGSLWNGRSVATANPLTILVIFLIIIFIIFVINIFVILIIDVFVIVIIKAMVIVITTNTL